jgi:hypothetical protein
MKAMKNGKSRMSGLYSIDLKYIHACTLGVCPYTFDHFISS